MTAALLLSLALGAAFADDATPPPTTPVLPAPASPAAVPEKDRQPNPGGDGGVTPYGLKDFDETVKADLKQMESDAKDTLRAIEAQDATEQDLETRQLKEKSDFRRRLRGERAAFERAMIDDWKKFVEKLRVTEPAERGSEKVAYDQKSLERRRKREEEEMAKQKDFIEKQQRERDEFWTKLQKDNNERAQKQLEHATKWGKPAAPR